MLAPMLLLLQPALDSSALERVYVQDTFIESAAPDANYGRDPLLSGGPNKVVLVRFVQLPTGQNVEGASVWLKIELGGEPKLESVGRVLAPWGEGPGRRGFFGRRDLPTEGAPAWSATWRQRRGGKSGVSWQKGGASGDQDAATVTGWSTRVERVEAGSGRGDWLVIDGLGPTFAQFAKQPHLNFGIALRFSNAVDFDSSENRQAAPRLELHGTPMGAGGSDLAIARVQPNAAPPYKPGAALDWVATIVNRGQAPAAPFILEWDVHERRTESVRVDKALAPGEAATVTISLPYRGDVADPRQHPIRASLLRPDGDPSNDSVTVFEAATPLALSGDPVLAQALIGRLNDVAFPYSRFSFAPDGAKERVRLVEGAKSDEPSQLTDALSALGLREPPRPYGPRPSLDRYAGLSGRGDTRDEGLFASQLALEYDGWADPATDEADLPASGLLSLTDVALLDAWRLAPESRGDWRVAMPKSVILRVADLWNRPLVGAEVEVASGASVKKFKVAEGGIVSIGEPFAGAPSVLLKATRGGVTEYQWLKAWQAIDTARRSSSGVALMNARFMLPSDFLDLTTNLALGKLVTDSAGTAPLALVGLVDGDPATGVTAPSDGWVEVDLGRDRAMGEVRLVFEGDLWPSFDILAYATGQPPSEARPWASERNGVWAGKTRFDQEPGAPKSIAYRAPTTRARFIRIVGRGGSAPKLLDIIVRPVLNP